MYSAFLHFVRNQRWLAILLCIVPVLIYFIVFRAIALNVNYVAFDDISILSIIPLFENAGLAEKWKLLTELFPEHRLVFSRSVILTLYHIFGRVDLVWPMVIANSCWGICAFVFFRAFRKLNMSFWYFLPIAWLWFNIQSFENIFWGVSSLCNFGVLLFVLTALYFCIYHPTRIILTMIFAIAATFTYGNGLMVFPVIALAFLVSGYRVQAVATLVVMGVVSSVYFIDFTPITQNLDLSDPAQLSDGFFGFFGFLGSIATITAYAIPPGMLRLGVGAGMLFALLLVVIYWKQLPALLQSITKNQPFGNRTALFAVAIAAFVAITALALTYKRIPTDTFLGMFKGRYRMYSVLLCIAIYFALLSTARKSVLQFIVPILALFCILLNLVILQANFADAVNNRRAAITQEFNARYNADWLGIRMFSMNQEHFEKIRSYYLSEDPVAEGWNPRAATVPCDSTYVPDLVEMAGNHLLVSFAGDFFEIEKDYSDGAYVVLKSDKHVYASPPNQTAVPLKTTLRRQMYFSKGAFASFHEAIIEPGSYDIFLIVRKNGLNRIYCTGKTWEEKN